MKIILFLIFLSLCSIFHSQTKEEAIEVLETVNDLSQVDSLKHVHSDWYITSSKTLPVGFGYDSLLFHAKVGEIVETQISNKAPKFQRKVIAKGNEEVCKAMYIYLNGKKHTMTEIQKLREEIINKYNNGTPFLELVKMYNEDGNPTGELNWFYRGMMTEEFDTAVRKQKAGKIFIVDVPINDWFYVVLKSEENKTLECTYSIGIKVGT